MSVVYQYEQPKVPFNAPDGAKKKLIIAVGVLLACITIIIVVLLVGSSKNVAKDPASAEPTAQDFVAAVLENDTETIRKVSTFKTDLSDDEIATNGDPLEVLRGFADLATCKFTGSESENLLKYTCDRLKAKKDTKIYLRTFELKLNNEGKVTEILYEKNADN